MKSFFEALDNYNLVYIEFNFSLRKKDRLHRLSEKNLSLKKFRKEILIKAKESNIRFSYQDFQRLDKILNNFDKINESLTIDKIIIFMVDTLKSINFWKVDDIKEQLFLMLNLR